MTKLTVGWVSFDCDGVKNYFKMGKADASMNFLIMPSIDFN